MKYFYLIFIILLLIIFNGCQMEKNMENEIDHLLNTDNEFAQTSLNKGAAEAFKMFLDSNAVQFPSGGGSNFWKR